MKASWYLGLQTCEFLPTKHLRLSIEKDVFLDGDHWIIKIAWKLKFLTLPAGNLRLPSLIYQSQSTTIKFKKDFWACLWIIQKEKERDRLQGEMSILKIASFALINSSCPLTFGYNPGNYFQLNLNSVN